MQSVPPAMRREVWELVDTPRRLWTEMFSLWGKHPPGWWWALDRPGDRRRCLRRLAINLVVAFLIATAAVVAADSVVIRSVQVVNWYDRTDTACAIPLGETGYVEYWGLFGGNRYGRLEDVNAYCGALNEAAANQYQLVTRRPRQSVIWQLSLSSVFTASLVVGWMFCLWAAVSFIGLWTQIRKGLPSFARAPRTIIAASCLESCKLVYLGVIIALAAAAETVLRLGLFTTAAGVYSDLWFALCLLVVALGIAGWIGPLRSDFTRRLVRSRVHLVRILIMYALVMPFALLIPIAALTEYLAFKFGWY